MFRLSKIIFEYPLIYIVGVAFLITALLSVFISFFPRKSLKSEIDEVNLERKITKKSLVISFISGCLIMPLLETLIFQFSVIRLMQIFFTNANAVMLFSIIISSLLFSLAHLVGRSFFDVLTRIPLGIALALVFLICDFRKTHPIAITYFFHFMWNFLFVIVFPIVAIEIKKMKS